MSEAEYEAYKKKVAPARKNKLYVFRGTPFRYGRCTDHLCEPGTDDVLLPAVLRRLVPCHVYDRQRIAVQQYRQLDRV